MILQAMYESNTLSVKYYKSINADLYTFLDVMECIRLAPNVSSDASQFNIYIPYCYVIDFSSNKRCPAVEILNFF